MRDRCERDPESGCLIWTGGKTGLGYGALRVGPGRGKVKLAHREMYEREVGPIPKGYVVDHVCANEPGLTPAERLRRRACLEPSHLEAVTSAENTRRGTKAILTPEIVAEIHASEEPSNVIAARFGVQPAAISKVRTGRNWTGLAEAA